MRRFLRRSGAWAPALAIATLPVLAAGCGSGSASATGAATSSADSGGTLHVVMKVLEFNPTTVQAKVGQRLTWTNEDRSPHNVTYISGPGFRSSRPVLDPGATYSITLAQPGTIHYYCSIHPWMKATIVVSP
jgi:plastocyanin